MSLMMYNITYEWLFRKRVSDTLKVGWCTDLVNLKNLLNLGLKIQHRTFFLLFFLSLSKTFVFAQQTPTKPFATLDSNVVLIGDKVVLNIGVIHDGSTRVVNVLPDLHWTHLNLAS